METKRHRELAGRLAIEQLLLRLPDDYEIWIEGLMHRATHVLNARLHETGTTTSDQDLIHVGMPRDISPSDPELSQLMNYLRRCERLRELHVRGPREDGAAAVHELQGLMRLIDRL